MKPSDIFLPLAVRGPVPHGKEDGVYGEDLAALGFERKPGVWVLGDDRPVILAGHLDTTHGTKPRAVKVQGGLAQGQGGMMGADDKAGVALIMWLARQKFGEKEGVGYALFLGEEVGCAGAEEAREAGLFAGAGAMISLDRKGTSEVIYAQGGQTASLEAARWLAKSLGMGHTPSNNGVWTDSAVYAGVIPECMNLSVGYHGAHTDKDVQDVRYLDTLGEAMLRVRWAEMPIVREPKEVWRVSAKWWDWPTTQKGGGKSKYRWWRWSVREVMDTLRTYGMVEEALEYLLETRPHLVDELVEELGLDEEVW